MALILSDKEIAAVLLLDGPQRYSYWVKKVADQQVVWSLWQADGWALAGDDQGRQLVPVWPHEKYAELCACGTWTGYTPKSIELNAWMKHWIPGMRRETRMVAVFPTPDDRGIAVGPAKLSQDLEEELSNYE